MLVLFYLVFEIVVIVPSRKRSTPQLLAETLIDDAEDHVFFFFRSRGTCAGDFLGRS
jgi:hypothetical protein